MITHGIARELKPLPFALLAETQVVQEVIA